MFYINLQLRKCQYILSKFLENYSKFVIFCFKFTHEYLINAKNELAFEQLKTRMLLVERIIS